MTDRSILEKAAKAITLMLEDMGLKKVGFAVLVFDFGSGGNLGWVSNAERSTMIEAMKEFVEKNGGLSIFTH